WWRHALRRRSWAERVEPHLPGDQSARRCPKRPVSFLMSVTPAKRSGGCVGNAVAGGWTRRAARARTRSGRAALPEEAGQLRDGGDAAEAARLVGGDVAAGGRGTVRAENTVKPRFRSISYLAPELGSTTGLASGVRAMFG